MNRVGRALAALVGVGGLAAAVVLVVAPGAVDGVSAAALVALAGNDYVLAVAVAAAAVAVVVAVLGARGVGGVNAATPPDPETVETAPRPGVAFDRAVDGGSWLSSGGDREAVRERLRRAAVRSEARRNGLSRDEAATRVASGAWTDDRVAAAFLGDARGPPTRRLLGLLPGEGRFRRDAKRTADVLCRREGVAGGER